MEEFLHERNIRPEKYHSAYAICDFLFFLRHAHADHYTDGKQAEFQQRKGLSAATAVFIRSVK